MAVQLVTKREGLTGGATGVSGDVDGISATDRGDGNALQEGDLCDVVVSGNVFNYKYSSGTADVENSPYLIKPDTGAASGYAWILQNKIAGLDTSTTIADADKIEVLKDSTGLSVNMARSDFMEHNIAYHDDTTATGNELNTLTDGSMADNLHGHSELSASDGSPSPAVSVDTNGVTSFISDTAELRVLTNRNTYIDSSENSTDANIFVTGAGAGDFSSESGHLVLQARVQGTVYRDIILAGGLSSSEAIMRVTGEGQVGIGKAPSAQFEISTDDAIKPTTNTWTIFSGKELKENIELANLDLCYENFKKAKLKRYRYKDDCYSDSEINDRHMLGFIASDIELINPKSVKNVKFIKQPEESETVTIQEEIKDKNGKIIQPLKTEKKIIKEEISIDTKNLNNDQNLMGMFGTVRKLQMMVEELQDRIDILESENKDTKEK